MFQAMNLHLRSTLKLMAIAFLACMVTLITPWVSQAQITRFRGLYETKRIHRNS